MMPCSGVCRAATLCGAWLVCSPVHAVVAQQKDPGAGQVAQRELTAAGVPLVDAVRVDDAPLIDGDVLNDPAYADARLAIGFVQNRPFEGEPASERTEVRIVYTGDTLYFGVVCYTEDPTSIIAADSRRDTDMTETDSFQIILDTYRDGQNGFVFGTNPAGVEYDGQVTNEGRGSGRFGGGGSGRPGNSRQQRGSGGGFNLNWDGAWQVVTSVTNIGWTAEIAIHAAISADRGAIVGDGTSSATSGSGMNRLTGRHYRVSTISIGSRSPVNSGRSECRRRGICSSRRTRWGETLSSAEDGRNVSTGDIGADLKYSVTPSLTLDVTYNTDFAQVEVDDEQVNLDRFTLFFPEKRPFFLENAGLFSVGQSGAVDIFFSRRIGLGDDGEPIPILGGGRLSGKVGTNTNVGFLNLQTQSVDASGTPMQNFTVARVRQDLANRSNVGAMFVNRQATGSLAGDQDYNRSYALDGRWGIGQGGTVSGFVAKTDTPGASAGSAHAYAVSARHESQRARLRLGYTEVAPNFNPEVGFLARESYRQITGSVFTTFRPENFMGVHEIRPHVNHNTYVDYESGLYETQLTHIDNHIEWRNGYEIHTGMNITREGVFEAFDIFSGVIVPPGTYDHKEAQIAGNTNLGAPVSANINTIIGGLFGGDRVTITPSIAARVGETVNATVEWSYNDLRLPGGDFTTNLARLRLSYSFTTRMFFQALVQYNDRADLWSSNLRFGLLSDANTGLFIVYNDVQGLGSEIPSGAGRTLTLKYSYLFNLLR